MITSIVSVFLVVFTVLLLPLKISDGPCPVIQGTSSGIGIPFMRGCEMHWVSARSRGLALRLFDEATRSRRQSVGCRIRPSCRTIMQLTSPGWTKGGYAKREFLAACRLGNMSIARMCDRQQRTRQQWRRGHWLHAPQGVAACGTRRCWKCPSVVS